MILTGNYKNFMNDPRSISISGDRGRSVGYKGDFYKKLAPKYFWWKDWEELRDKVSFYDSIMFYMNKYYETVLSQLDPKQVYDELEGRILLCFENSDEFCHRHIVAEWLELSLGVKVSEVVLIEDKLVTVSRPNYVKELLPLVIKNYKSNNKILSKTNDQFTPIN